MKRRNGWDEVARMLKLLGDHRELMLLIVSAIATGLIAGVLWH